MHVLFDLDGSLSDKTELLAHVLESEKILPQNAVMIGDRRFDALLRTDTSWLSTIYFVAGSISSA